MHHKDDFRLPAFNAMKALAKLARDCGELAKAEETLKVAYERAKLIFGENHGEVGLVLLQLSEVSDKQGNSVMAEQYRRKSDQILYRYLEDINS
jgi:hypothetical protein